MSRVEAFFLPLSDGHRLCVLHSSSAASSGAILYIHPFGDEMNRTRRMVALQARALASAGWTVLQLDLLGCGDSYGEHGEANWTVWVNDVVAASVWLAEQSGFLPSLWGLRTGCLLASQAAKAMPSSPNFLLWQPVISGEQFLRQYLRLNIAGGVLSGDAQDRGGTKQLYDQLAGGVAVEVGGYAISPALAKGLGASTLSAPPPPARVAWLEVVAPPETELRRASQDCVHQWRAAGVQVATRIVQGPLFWQTQEVTECPSLLEATLTELAGWRT